MAYFEPESCKSFLCCSKYISCEINPSSASFLSSLSLCSTFDDCWVVGRAFGACASALLGGVGVRVMSGGALSEGGSNALPTGGSLEAGLGCGVCVIVEVDETRGTESRLSRSHDRMDKNSSILLAAILIVPDIPPTTRPGSGKIYPEFIVVSIFAN